jgi:hypothetical protein
VLFGANRQIRAILYLALRNTHGLEIQAFERDRDRVSISDFLDLDLMDISH